MAGSAAEIANASFLFILVAAHVCVWGVRSINIRNRVTDVRSSNHVVKKYQDLKICTRPTCRSILGDDIRKENISQPEVFFFKFTN